MKSDRLKSIATSANELSGAGALRKQARDCARWAVHRAVRVDSVRRSLRHASHRSHRLAEVLCHVPVNGRIMVPVPGADASFRYHAQWDDHVIPPIHWRDLYAFEPESLVPFVKHARRARAFLDVGAFVGLYSLVAGTVNPRLTGWAFEPVPASYPRLEENLALNGLQTRIVAKRAAVTDSRGTGCLFIPGGDQAAAPSSHLFQPGELREGAEIAVETLALDDTIPTDAPIDLMKVDVEGAEAAVLRGAARLLERCRPTLFIEFLPWIDTESSVKLLTDLNYKIMLLSPGSAQEVQSTAAQGSLSNFLCLPLERE